MLSFEFLFNMYINFIYLSFIPPKLLITSRWLLRLPQLLNIYANITHMVLKQNTKNSKRSPPNNQPTTVINILLYCDVRQRQLLYLLWLLMLMWLLLLLLLLWFAMHSSTLTTCWCPITWRNVGIVFSVHRSSVWIRCNQLSRNSPIWRLLKFHHSGKRYAFSVLYWFICIHISYIYNI